MQAPCKSYVLVCTVLTHHSIHPGFFVSKPLLDVSFDRKPLPVERVVLDNVSVLQQTHVCLCKGIDTVGFIFAHLPQ